MSFSRVRDRDGHTRRSPGKRILAMAACVAGIALSLAGAGPATASAQPMLASSPDAFQPQASAAVPTVTGPIAGTPPTDPGGGVGLPSAAVLAADGYRQQEFFISGKADAYNFAGTPGSEGRWTVTVAPGTTQSYTTRLEVITPVNPSRFSGNVVVEWDNVTDGLDSAPDLLYDHDELFRSGGAWIGVSAQYDGVENAKLSDPSRYGSLRQPGDSYAYDIFSQAGMAVRAHYAQLLGGLKPRDIIADGESQSAIYLATYVDAFAKRFNVYDGYLIHSRTAYSSPLQQAPAPASVSVNGTTATLPSDGNAGLSTESSPPTVLIRTDLTAPVITFETESDVYTYPVGLLAYGTATQADSAGFRLWEGAGDAHIDDCPLNTCDSDTGNLAGAQARFNSMLNPPAGGAGITCPSPVNTGEEGYSVGEALEQLAQWASTGGLLGIPAIAPPLFAGQSPGEATTGLPVRDANGNIIGGLRTPAVDVPVATLAGTPQSGSGALFCVFFGQTTPFPAAKLQALYSTHADFVAAWDKDVASLVFQRELDPADATLLDVAAAASTVP
jgi:Alpha/beta hydrolase domain